MLDEYLANDSVWAPVGLSPVCVLDMKAPDDWTVATLQLLGRGRGGGRGPGSTILHTRLPLR